MLRSRLLLTGGGYKIKNSLRFNDDDSAYLSRTPAGAGNRKTWTWSGWVKRANLHATDYKELFTAYPGTSAIDRLGFYADKLVVHLNGGSSGTLETTAVFRDSASHYHIVLAVDTPQATAANRLKLYVNGVQVTSFITATYPSQNYDTLVNSTNAHALCANLNGPQGYFDGLLSEVNFIDGQALDPSYFGKTDSVTGAWIPKKYSGTYGTNGFYLDFKDGTSTTTLGYDRSGNGNNWTLNNLATTDQMTDTPTNTYCTLNPLDAASTLSDGSLRVSSGNQLARGTFWPTSGKWYWECKMVTTVSVSGTGLARAECALSGPGGTGNLYNYLNTGEKSDGGANSAYGNSFTNGDTIGVAYDANTRTLWFSKNGTWQNGATQSEIEAGTTTNAAWTGISNVPWTPKFVANTATAVAELNFGQRPFAYTPPTGFKSLCTDNLPTPSIKKPSKYFKPLLYTADTSGGKTISGLDFPPDLVWIKNRDNVEQHYLTDSVRGFGGAGTSKFLKSNSNAAEASVGADVTFAVESGGFTITDTNYNSGELYFNGRTYVAWCFKKGATPGFDIQTFLSPASGNIVVNHALGVAPKWIIVKSRDGARPWVHYNENLSAPADRYLEFTTAAEATISGIWPSVTSSSFTGTVGGSLSPNENYVAYLFAEVPGFSRIGKYTGNGSADGPFVWCGFKPRYLLIKRTDAVQDWYVQDTSRSPSNVVNTQLAPNLSVAEGSLASGYDNDILSNGFKVRNSVYNVSGGTYIFVAFAEHPFKYARAA